MIALNEPFVGQIRAKIWEYTSFGGLLEGQETFKSIYSCWQHFAGKDFRAFLAGKQIIKFLFKGIIFHHFKLHIISFHNKRSQIRHTSKNRSLGTPVFTIHDK